MVLMLMRATGISGDWVGLVCGMAGWIGPRILDSVADQAEKVAGLKANEKRKGAGEE